MGSPKDFDFLDCDHSVSLLTSPSIDQGSLAKWGNWFNSRLSPDRHVVVGYSLGGRLALHALIDNPTAYQGAVVISSHPGLTSTLERAMRKESDALLAKQFLTKPWDQLMKNWNRQSVFESDFPLKRNEKECDRTALYRALMQWSLGEQEDLRKPISQLDVPILWIAGEKDAKYRKIAEEMSFYHPLSKIWIAPQGGHRVHCTNQESLVNCIKEFEETICR